MGPQLAYPRSGRAAILDAIRAAGSISRVELVRSTGRTGATVSTTVRRLIEEGLVVETGRGRSTGGKPRTQLSLDPQARGAVGRWRTAGLGADAPPAVVQRIADEVRGLLQGIGTPQDRILQRGGHRRV